MSRKEHGGAEALARWLRERVNAGMKDDEQRAHPRAPIQVEAVLLPLDGRGNVVPRRRREAVVVDISRGGARLVAEAPVDPGPVQVQIGDGEAGLVMIAELLDCRRQRARLFILRVRFSGHASGGPQGKPEPA